MEYIIYSFSDQKLALLQNTSSIQWMPRYYETGKFEIHAAFTEMNRKYLSVGNRILKADSNEVGYITYVGMEPDENGELEIEIRGEMDILNQRININTATISNIEKGIENLINQNKRFLDLQFINSGNIHEICNPPRQTTWKELRTTIIELCQEFGIGFRTVKKGKHLNNVELYQKGLNNKVKFSDDLGNIVSQSYINNLTDFKNIAYVCGEGEGPNRKVIKVDLSFGGPKYEMYVDAKNITREYTDAQGNQKIYSEKEYENILKNYGYEKLQERQQTNEFAVELRQSDNLFRLGIDYEMGDIVKTESKKIGILKFFRISGINYIEEDIEKIEIVLSIDNQTEQIKGGFNLWVFYHWTTRLMKPKI